MRPLWWTQRLERRTNFPNRSGKAAFTFLRAHRRHCRCTVRVSISEHLPDAGRARGPRARRPHLARRHPPGRARVWAPHAAGLNLVQPTLDLLQPSPAGSSRLLAERSRLPPDRSRVGVLCSRVGGPVQPSGGSCAAEWGSRAADCLPERAGWGPPRSRVGVGQALRVPDDRRRRRAWHGATAARIHHTCRGLPKKYTTDATFPGSQPIGGRKAGLRCNARHGSARMRIISRLTWREAHARHRATRLIQFLRRRTRRFALSVRTAHRVTRGVTV